MDNPILLELHAHAGQLESISIHFNRRDYLLRADHSRDLTCSSDHDGSDEVQADSQVRGEIPELGSL